MTPNARYAAAIDVLGRILEGEPAEKTLTNWARSNRYAGSKDRAGVRDIVFDCLRQKRSLMHNAGFDGVRGLIAGHILASNLSVADVFTGERFAADVLTPDEQGSLSQAKNTALDAVRLDVPDWLEPKLRFSLMRDFEASLTALQTRAPLDLRVNIRKATVAQVQASLGRDDIETNAVANVTNALRVIKNPRRVALSKAYQDGLVEIQDAGSQAVIDALPMQGVNTVLDYCAGGGGKTLALAAISDVQVDAYDQNKTRMKDLTVRAKRAGVLARVLNRDPVILGKTYDLVLLDVPCSGTGAWRRNPDGKWRFSDADLQDLIETQAGILARCSKLVADGGIMAYVTCSLLYDENEAQIERFLATEENWDISKSRRFNPSGETDGFFLTVLQVKQL
jgi:16S rRNA (cytosine967-C5)-methyltransferase